jgi:hypothetical protein
MNDTTTKNATRQAVREIPGHVWVCTEYGRHAIEWYHEHTKTWVLIREFYNDAEIAEADLERLQRFYPNTTYRVVYNHPVAWTTTNPQARRAR